MRPLLDNRGTGDFSWGWKILFFLPKGRQFKLGNVPGIMCSQQAAREVIGCGVRGRWGDYMWVSGYTHHFRQPRIVAVVLAGLAVCVQVVGRVKCT